MNHPLPLLEHIRVASPCSASWDSMEGDEKVRHCRACNLSVYNLAAMTRAEAEALLGSAGAGRVCARFYRRADGTVMTSDCPVGVTRARARTRRMVARIAAAFGLAGATAMAGVRGSHAEPLGPVRLRAFRPFSTFAAWLVPTPPPMPPAVTPNSIFVMGDICPAPPPAPLPSAPPTP